MRLGLSADGAVGSFDELAVLEDGAGADEGDVVWRVDGTPAGPAASMN
jgi:hypothetical protein